jgi:hypothetical protein
MTAMAAALPTRLLHGELPQELPPLVLGGLLYLIFSRQPPSSLKA